MPEPKIPFFPKKVLMDVTEKSVRAFITESEESLEAFLDWMFQAHDYTMSEYIDDKLELFTEFVLSGGGAQ